MNREQIKTLKILAEIAREEKGVPSVDRWVPQKRHWSDSPCRTNGTALKRELFHLVLFLAGMVFGFCLGVEYRIFQDILHW